MTSYTIFRAAMRTEKECTEWLQYGGQCYYVSTDKANHQSANDECITLGGSLASVNNPFIGVFLVQNLREDDYWIGLVGSSRWRWYDGSMANSLFWYIGEPTGDAACVRTVTRGGALADLKCYSRYNKAGGEIHCICQKALSTAAVCPEHWERYQEHCYIVSQGPVSALEGQNLCYEYGAHLVKLYDTGQISFLASLANYNEYWVGITSFEWVSEVPYIYQNWGIQAHGERGPGAMNTCVVIRYSGEWFNTHCNSSRKYICQKAIQDVPTPPPILNITAPAELQTTPSSTSSSTPTETTSRTSSTVNTPEITTYTTTVTQPTTSTSNTSPQASTSTSTQTTTRKPTTPSTSRPTKTPTTVIYTPKQIYSEPEEGREISSENGANENGSNENESEESGAIIQTDIDGALIIVLGVIGFLILLAALAVIVITLYRKRRDEKLKQQAAALFSHEDQRSQRTYMDPSRMTVTDGTNMAENVTPIFAMPRMSRGFNVQRIFTQVAPPDL